MEKKLDHFLDVISDDVINALDGCDLTDYVDKNAITIVIEKGGNIAIYEKDLQEAVNSLKKHIKKMEAHLLKQGHALLVEDWRAGKL